jgi:hypothetical protein
MTLAEECHALKIEMAKRPHVVSTNPVARLIYVPALQGLGSAWQIALALTYITQPLRRLLKRRSIEREAQENGAASSEATRTGI